MLAKMSDWIKRLFKSFIFWRVLCFVSLCLLFGLVFFVSEFNNAALCRHHYDNSTSDIHGACLPFVDALFLSVSLMSATGLQTTDFSLWGRTTQSLAMIPVVLGSLVISSAIPVAARLFILTLRSKHDNSSSRNCILVVLVVLVLYYVVFAVLLAAMFGVLCQTSFSYVFTDSNPPSEPWFGGFVMAMTAFSNCGMTPFTYSAAPLLPFPGLLMWLCAFMLMGNIAFPLCLRGMFDLLARMNVPGTKFVLANPREYYQMLFPWTYLAFLSFFWATFYVINFALFLGLEWGNSMNGLRVGQKIAASVFMSVSARTSGFSLFSLSSLRGADVAFDIIVFVISSTPNTIAMRASSTSTTKTAKQYTTELLINVVVGLSVSWILLLLLEYSNPYTTPFAVLYEITSAFGTVGLSLGFGTSPQSLCGSFGVAGKLVIMTLMSIGSHRNVPDLLDPTVKDLTVTKAYSRARKRDFELEAFGSVSFL